MGERAIAAPTTSGDPGYVALEGGDARVEVVPSHGGRIRSLRLAGHEWLVQSPNGDGPKQGEPALAGAGWDECAPAAGGGTIPEWVKGIGGRPVPVGGEARLQAPEVSLRTDAEGHRLSCRWHGDRLPWTLTRVLLVRTDGAVEVRYEASTDGPQRLPFLWCANLLLPLTATTHLRLPEAGRFRISSVAGAKALGSVTEGEAKWPRLMIDGKVRDLSTPWSVPRKTTLTGWFDLGGTRSTILVTQDEAKLSITGDGAGIPHCGVVIARSGSNATPSRNPFARRLPPVLALRPSLGAPDRYAEALGDWQSVTWLAPGEPRRWTLTLRAGH